MANWKKVIVSGSNAELNHITASGNISASGFLFGNLPEDATIDQVVVYNQTTGQLEFKTLNLVNAQRAPELFLLDFDTDRTNTRFSLSFDSGSTTQPITAPFQFSASLDGGTTFPVSSSNTLLSINGGWDDVDVDDVVYFDPNSTINETASISEGNPDGPEDYRNGLITGGSKSAIRIHINRTDDNNPISVPSFTPGPAYSDHAFDSPQGVVGTTAGDTGSIQIFVNDMEAPKATFSLTGSGNSAITTEVNHITPKLSVSGAAVSTTNETDFSKSFRTGSFTIGTNHQVDGYNYAFAFYTGSRGGTQIRALTNLVEWFYDTDGAGEAMNNTNDYDFSWTGLDANSVVYRSGIKYYDASGADSSTAEYKVKQVNQYRNIYPHPSDSNNGFEVTYNPTPADSLTITQGSSAANHLATNPTQVTFNDAQSDGSNQIPLAPLADLNNAHLSDTEVTASMGVEFGELTTMNAQGTSGGIHFPSAFVSTDRPWSNNSTQLDLDLAIQFQHPNKDDKTKTSTGVDSFLVLANQNINANVTQYEDFKNETYRIQSGAYTDYTDPTAGGFAWNKETNIVDGGNGHNSGLLTFMSYLIYPNYAGKSADGGDYGSTYGPSQTNDYSPSGTSATGEREYFRYFQIPASIAGAKQLNIEFIGSGSICGDSNTAQFGTGKPGFKVEVNRTGGGGNSNYTGNFINAVDNKAGSTLSSGESIPIQLSAVSYDDSSTTGTGGSTGVPIGIVKVNDPNANIYSGGDYVIIRIITGQNWTGFINAMAVTIGNQSDVGRVIGNDETNF